MERDEIKIGLKGNYAYFKNITVTGINDKHVIMSNVNGDTKEVFKSLFLKYFKEQHTQKKRHCTQCERKKENPWCSNCIEKNCLIELEGTCEMIRKYLRYNKILEANDILRRRYNEMPNVRQTRTARVR